ncbi:MAG TPA: UbiA family prenyltransferase [Actinomycetota bacterium]|nr:UbiA family prenyltransferase [Actinomycetota bacterium]
MSSAGPSRSLLVAALRATHPLPAAAVTGLVTLVTAVRGADAATIGWVAAATAAGQASVGWSNDYLDRHLDAAAGRLDKPLVAGEVPAGTIVALALVALPLSVALSFPVGLAPAVLMLAAVASAWSYNAGLKSTVLSWAPYAVSFGLAPAYIWRATGDRPPAWLLVGGALIGVAAHLLNVIPDLDRDRTTRGLPHRLGLGGSLLLACAILIAALVLVLVAGRIGPWSWPAALLAGLLIAAVAWSGLSGRTHLSFRLAIASAAAIVLVLVVSPAGLGR